MANLTTGDIQDVDSFLRLTVGQDIRDAVLVGRDELGAPSQNIKILVQDILDLASAGSWEESPANNLTPIAGITQVNVPRLDIEAAAVGGSELLFEGKISDNANSVAQIRNTTSGSGAFSPGLILFGSPSQTRSSGAVIGLVLASEESGTKPVVQFGAYGTDSATDPWSGNFSALTSRILYDFEAYPGSAAPADNILSMTHDGKIGIGTQSPAVAMDFGAHTDAVKMVSGTTAQEPIASPGLIRYNTTTDTWRLADSSGWFDVPKTSGTPRLDQILNPTASKTFTFPGGDNLDLVFDGSGRMVVTADNGSILGPFVVENTDNPNGTNVSIPVGTFLASGTAAGDRATVRIGNAINQDDNSIEIMWVDDPDGDTENAFWLQFWGSDPMFQLKTDRTAFLDVISFELQNATSHFLMPVGTDAQRPSSPVVGMVRYSTTSAKMEVYTASGWETVTSAL